MTSADPADFGAVCNRSQESGAGRIPRRAARRTFSQTPPHDLGRGVGRSVLACPSERLERDARREVRIMVEESKGSGIGAMSRRALRLALGWTDRIAVLTHGPTAIAPDVRGWLAGRGIAVAEGRIEGLEGEGRGLSAVPLEGGRARRGRSEARPRTRQGSPLGDRLPPHRHDLPARSPRRRGRDRCGATLMMSRRSTSRFSASTRNSRSVDRMFNLCQNPAIH